MATIEGIVKIHGAGLAKFPTRFDSEISGAHSSLSHVVDTMEKMSLVIVRLGELGRIGQDCREDFSHDILISLTYSSLESDFLGRERAYHVPRNAAGVSPRLSCRRGHLYLIKILRHLLLIFSIP